MSSMSGQTLLVVDDSPLMQEIIRRAITGNYRLLMANNATKALSLMAQEAIAILILDVSMPEIDGFELCRTLRSLPQFQQLPIIMLTARNGAFDRVQARLAGATEYLTKPFDAAELNQLIERLLGSNTPV